MLNIPPWDSLHPLVIHFPIALLLVAPLFLFIGAVMRVERGRLFAFAALLLMVLGTAGAWLAVATGESAAEVTAPNAAMKANIEQHEELAESTRAVFTVLTLAYAAIVLLPFLQGQARRMITTALPLAFLVIYVAGAVLLAKTAHEGGRLVHELGSSAPAVAEADHD
ncbi:MAG TPA: DUF2231 domain-containing protein [Thermoanaerobaculia bacterium]|nr:DUF2231 domain-containing protein [Thermoanaerobaculia bacterium]